MHESPRDATSPGFGRPRTSTKHAKLAPSNDRVWSLAHSVCVCVCVCVCFAIATHGGESSCGRFVRMLLGVTCLSSLLSALSMPRPHNDKVAAVSHRRVRTLSFVRQGRCSRRAPHHSCMGCCSCREKRIT